MAATDTEISVGIKATFEGFFNALNNAASLVKDSTTKMSESFEGVNKSVEKIRGSLAAFAGLLAGGAIFGESISAAEKFTFAVQSLHETLGITTQAASGIKIALDEVGISTETYEGMAKRLDRQIRTNSKGLQEMGLQVRDTSTGALLPQQEILKNAVEVLGQYKIGTDRNIESQVLFGRGSNVSYEQLKRFTEAMDESTAHGSALNLILGSDSVSAMRDYQKSMNESKAVLEALEIALGTVVMPALKRLSDWFKEVGPTALKEFTAVLGAVEDVVLTVSETFYGLGQYLAALVITFKEGATGIWSAITTAFTGADNDAEKAIHNIDEAWAVASKNIEENLHRVKDSIEDAFNAGEAASFDQKKDEEGTKSATGQLKKGKETTMFGEYKAALEQQKVDKQEFFRDDIAGDIAYWEEKRALVAKGSKDQISIDHELYSLKKQAAQQDLRIQLEVIKEQMVAAKGNFEQQEALAIKAQKLIASKYGEESSEARKATTEILRIAEQRQQQLNTLAVKEIEAKRIHQDNLTAMELEHARHLNALHVTDDDQFIAEEARLHEAEYQADLKANEEKLNFLIAYPDQYQAMLDKILAMVDKHNIDLEKAQDKAVEQNAKTIQGYLAPVTSAIEGSINGLIQGTLTAQKALANIGQSILGEFIKTIVRSVSEHIAGELAKTAATVAGVGARTTVEATGAVAGSALEKTTGMASIMRDAYKAAAGAYAALAGIPFVGPVLAPVGAAVAFAAVGAFGSAFGSAAGGWDIPAGVNPVAQLHAKEMVLPAAQAEVIRQLAEGGSVGAGVVHYHDHSGSATPEMLRRNADIIVKILNEKARGFAFSSGAVFSR